jgi:uncharacterized protein
MRVVDTSAWIEWLMDTNTASAVGQHMPERGNWLVPTIVQLELVKWLQRNFHVAETDGFIAFTQLCMIEPLTTNIAISAAELCVTKKLATADAIIYATALENDAELLTCDAHFKDLPNVIYVPKVLQA